MIVKLASVKGVEHTITTPFVNQVTEDLKKYIFRSNEKSVTINKSMYENNGSDYNVNVLDNSIGKEVLEFEYEIEENEELSINSTLLKPINKVIYGDEKTGTAMRLVFIATDFKVTYKYKTLSKIEANKIKNMLTSYFNTSGYNLTHDLEYSVILPDNLISLLKNIYKLSESKLDFFDYLNSNATYEFDLGRKSDTEYTSVGWRGMLKNVFGYIETKPNEIKVEKEDNEYVIGFEYSFMAQVPKSILVQYPILVNNKKLDNIWLPEETVVSPVERGQGNEDISIIANKEVRVTLRGDVGLFRVPTYDTFAPIEYENALTKFIISILLEVEEDTATLFTLDDLKQIGIREYIIDYMKKRRERELFKLGGALFLMQIFEGDILVDKGLYKTEDNIIKVKKPLDKNKIYHLTISVVVDLGIMKYGKITGSREEDISFLEEMNIRYNETYSPFVSTRRQNY